MLPGNRCTLSGVWPRDRQGTSGSPTLDGRVQRNFPEKEVGTIGQNFVLKRIPRLVDTLQLGNFWVGVFLALFHFLKEISLLLSPVAPPRSSS